MSKDTKDQGIPIVPTTIQPSLRFEDNSHMESFTEERG
jgi:hypothetical protein